MNFNELTAKQLLDARENGDPLSYVNHGEQTIYGTGSAQKVYLRVSEYFAITKKRDWSVKGLDLKVKEKHIVKEKYPQISNYWLSVKDQYVNTGSVSGEKDKVQFWQGFELAYGQYKKDPRKPSDHTKAPQREIAPGAFVLREDSALVDDIVVRRSCKFLLYDTINKGHDVAYALDDLDLNTVAKRMHVEETVNRSGVDTVERKVPICTSELREVFRRWDFFADHLTFYLNFKVCDPPWLTAGTSEWALYAAHLAKKIGKINNKHAGAAAQVDKLFSQGSHMMAIAAYHEMRPSVTLIRNFTNQVVANYE